VPKESNPIFAMILSLLRIMTLAALVLGLLPDAASAQNPPGQTQAAPSAPALTAAEARQAIEVLQDPQKREQLIAVLKAITAAAPAVAPAPAPAPAPAAMPAVTLRPHSLGAELLVVLSRWSSQLAAETAAAVRATTNLPELRDWLSTLTTDPAAASTFLISMAWVVLVVACALALELIASWILRRPRRALIRNLPTGNGDSIRLLRTLPLALIGLVLDLMPVAMFAATGNLLAGLAGMNEQARLIVLAVVNAYAICRAVMCAGRMVVAPSDRRLRLWRLDDRRANFAIAWLRRITIVAVFGNALIEAALLLGLDQNAHDGLDRLLSLVLAILLIVVVVRSRRAVAGYIRAPRYPDGEVARWRVWLAEAWPYLAVITIVTGWIGLATETGGGLAALYFPGVTLAAVIGARLVTIIVVGTLDRLLRLDPATSDQLPGLGQRLTRYRRPLEGATVAVIAVLSAIVLLQLWGAPAFAWFVSGRVGSRLISALATIVVAVLAAILLWEVTQAMLEHRLARLGDDPSRSRSARLVTLLPMLRTALLATILTVVGLTALSEIGVNITPLLAGASIAGIAIGFGAQRLVQDVITGIFVLIENAIQIGDGVTVAGLSGTVEQLSVRTMRLRAGDGAVHIIPFSAVTSITNSNRGIGNAVISVTVAYDVDTDRVVETLTEIGAGLRDDPAFAPQMLADVQIFGVDQVRPWGVTITGQIQCTDTGRGSVQREFNRRLKKRFEELDIALGGPPNVIVQS
jgi:small-conductance mechanosensitive channel